MLDGAGVNAVGIKKTRRLSQTKDPKKGAVMATNNKQKCPTGETSLTFDAFKNYMDNNFGKDLKEVKEDLKSTRREMGDKVETIAVKLAAQENDVADLQRSVMRLEEKERNSAAWWKDEANKLKQDLAKHFENSSQGAGVASEETRDDCSMTPQERSFYKARRSIQLWPIEGLNTEQVWISTGDFLHDILEISESDMNHHMIENISRIENKRRPGISLVNQEVVVTFKNAAARDTVLRASSKLTKMKDEAGKPTAGVRLHIPNNLRGVFTLLERYGHFMRQRHGKGTKTHIKFDESELSLFTSVKLPGEEEWARITPVFARKTMRNRDVSMSESLEGRYGSNSSRDYGPIGTRRTISESTANMSTDEPMPSTSGKNVPPARAYIPPSGAT